MLLTPKEILLKSINPLEYYKQEFPTWNGSESSQVQCPLDERHEGGGDHTPSLSINPDTGEFYCHGCGWSGTSVVGFHTDVHCYGSIRVGLASLFSRYIREVISPKKIKHFIKNLRSDDKLLTSLTLRRGWLPATVRALRLGWDTKTKRVVIPIFNSEDYCLDYRLHDSLYRAEQVNGKRKAMMNLPSAQSGEFFPLTKDLNPFAAEKTEVWCVEGEPDAITAFQEGLNVVTVTGGGAAWGRLPYSKLQAFENKDVIFCRDNDAPGVAFAAAFAERLVTVDVASLKVVTPPAAKDLTDYLVKHSGSIATMRELAAAAPYVIHPRKRNAVLVPLGKTSDADNYGTWLSTDILVNGQHHSPYIIPKRIEFSCQGEKCTQCPCRGTGKSEYYVQKDDPRILEWIYVNPGAYDAAVKQDMKLPKKCDLSARAVEYQNLQQLTCIPALSNKRSEDSGNYVMRSAYSLASNVETNQQYRAIVKPLLHPRSKESVLLIDRATGSSDSITQFKLTKEEVKELKNLFTDSPMQIIKDICNMLSVNHTRIYDRPDLHAVVELVFHSVISFSFCGVHLRKTGLEALILGDTRCGKGQVTEGILQFYDLGTVVSGENSSFMGLAGGATKVGDQFGITWGAIPLNHGRLVVVDECSDIGADIFGKLSRIRSEGIAEIAKGGIISKTSANTRLVWITNCREGREVASYGSGVSAISHLIRNHEDIARFDVALVVAKGEVGIEKINKSIGGKVNTKYTQELLRKVVLWVWSRKPEQVHFTEEATQFILQASAKLAGEYSATIPLIQGENARFKVAKIAAAVAGRCFSTEDGNSLTIRLAHAKTAVSLIRHFYNKPVMGYKQFSDTEQGSKELTNQEELDKFFDWFAAEERKMIVEGLMSLELFKLQEMQDLCGTDANIARRHINLFVKCRAIRQKGAGVYVKKPSFTNYLKRKKNESNHA